MQEFYINVELRRGLTRIQVDEVPPEGWAVPSAPSFIIEFYAGGGFITLTILLKNGSWLDRNTRLTEDDSYLRYLELGPKECWNTDYESPLSTAELQRVGRRSAAIWWWRWVIICGFSLCNLPNLF